MPTYWTIAVGTTSAPQVGVNDYTSWTLDNNLDDGCTFSFDIRGNSTAGTYISELATDIWLYRGSAISQRFRVAAVEQSWDADGGDVATVRGICYRRMLQARHVLTPVTYTGVDQGTIVQNLITATQVATNGNLGITYGTVVTGTNRTRTYETGQNIYDAISELTKVQNGIEWDIDPSLVLQVKQIASPPYTFHPQPVMLGVNARTMSRPSAADKFANVAIVSGDSQETTPVISSATGLGSDPRGRWETTAAITSAKTQTQLTQLGNGLVETFQSPASTWRIEMEPTRYFYDSEYQTGDYIKIVQPRSTIYPIGTPAPVIDAQVIARSVTGTGDGQITVTISAIEVS